MFGHQRSNVYSQWPIGSIRGYEQLMDLVIEARKERKAIRLYTVEQSGYIQKIYIYSKTKLYKVGQARPKGCEYTDHGSILFPVFEEYNFKAGKPLIERMRKDFFFCDQHILGKHNSEFRLFSNRKAAEEYSNHLKTNKLYIQDVADHHSRCNEMFRNIGW